MSSLNPLTVHSKGSKPNLYRHQGENLQQVNCLPCNYLLSGSATGLFGCQPSASLSGHLPCNSLFPGPTRTLSGYLVHYYLLLGPATTLSGCPPCLKQVHLHIQPTSSALFKFAHHQALCVHHKPFDTL